MKTLIAILFVLLFSPACYAGGEKHGMNGRVKKVTEKVSMANSDMPSAVQGMVIDLVYIKSYDEQGRLTEEIERNSVRMPGAGNEQATEDKKTYHYNEKGWLTREERVGGSQGKEYKSLHEYVVDEQGRCLLEIFSRQDDKGTVNRTLYASTYNGSGQLAEVVTLVAEKQGLGSKEIGRQKNVYNDAGKLAESWYYDYMKKEFFLSSGYSYDNSGKQTELRQYGNDGVVRTTQTIRYDREGRELEKLTRNGDSEPIKAEYAYEDVDEKGNYRKITVTTPGKSPHIVTREIEYYP